MEAMERDLNTLRILFSSGTDDNNANAAENDLSKRITGTKQPLILELGPGTGIISSYTARLLTAAPVLTTTRDNDTTTTNNNNDIQPSTETTPTPFPTKSHPNETFSPRVIALDLNPVAVTMTKKTFEVNNQDTPTEVYESDLLSNLPPHYLNSINLLLFNPPYVPSEDYEHQNRDPNEMIMNAYAGGVEGRAILDQLIPQLTKLYTPSPLLSETTPTPDPINPFIFYCVFLWPVNNINSLNAMMDESIIKHFATTTTPTTTPTQRHYKSHIIMARQCGLESLSIVRYVPDYVYERFPPELMGLHPLATEENFKSIFQPKFVPYTAPTKASGNDDKEEGGKGGEDNDKDGGKEVEVSDDDDDDGPSAFSLF